MSNSDAYAVWLDRRNARAEAANRVPMSPVPAAPVSPIRSSPVQPTVPMLAAALQLAQRGWRVLPLAGKVPLQEGWPELATTDPAAITQWWSNEPRANVGIATGKQSNLFVLDIDVLKGGPESRRALEAKYGPLPETVEVLTGRGGGSAHLYFLYPVGRLIGNSASVLGPGLDIKTDGGQVVAPPSIHPETQRRYEWEAAHHPEDLPLAEAPAWLLDLLTAPTTAGQPFTSPERIPTGQRQDVLYRTGRSLKAKGLSREAMLAALQAENLAKCEPPLSQSEVTETADHAWTQADSPQFVANTRPQETPTVTTTATTATPWPTPEAMVMGVTALPYPTDALPEPIRGAVKEVQQFIQAPSPIVAGSALAALSLAIQPHVNVRRAVRLEGPVSLFHMAIAESGERKTSSDNFFTQALRDYDATQKVRAKPDLDTYEASLKIWDAKMKGLKQKIESGIKKGTKTETDETAVRELQQTAPEAPRYPRILYADVTPESLKWNLAKVWPSAGIFSSEGGIVLGSHGMNAESLTRNLGTMNQLWDGIDLPTDRRSSDAIAVRGARLTVGVQVQAPVLQRFIAGTDGLARGSGFLARFLVAWPDSTQGTRPFTDPPDTWPELDKFHTRLQAVLAIPVTLDAHGGLDPQLLTLSSGAKSAWITMHDEIEGQLAPGGALCHVRDIASKSAENAARLAALFHVFGHPSGNLTTIAKSQIAFESMTAAVRIVSWHLNEADRFYSACAMPAELSDPILLEDWILTQCRQHTTTEVRITLIQQFGPARLRTKAALEPVLHDLYRLHRLRPGKTEGAKVVHVNPALLSGRPS